MPQNNQPLQFVSQNPEIYDNTRSEVIFVMPDTLDNKLRDFEDFLKRKRDIQHDLSLIAAFLGTLVTTSQFRNFLNIPGNVWQSVFIVLLILASGRFLLNICKLKQKPIRREDILNDLLNNARKKK